MGFRQATYITLVYNFKNDHWLTEVAEKNNARLVIIGPQLSQVSSANKQEGCENEYMTLCLLDGTERIPSWELFESSLHEHTYNPSSNDIHFPSGITLNVHNLSEPYLSSLRKDPELRKSPTLIISDESRPRQTTGQVMGCFSLPAGGLRAVSTCL